MTVPPPLPVDRRGRGPTVLIATLCWATFLVSGSATAIAPFLLDLARDLNTDLAAVGSLVSFLSVAWGLASLVAGTLSDRIGRRPVLVAGITLMGGARLGLAQAGSYAGAVTWQLVGGVGGGTFMGTVFATVSDQVSPDRRGRALGWVVTGQSLALVLGVPLVTLIGSVGGWRGAIAAQGAAALVTVLGIWLVAPAGTPRPPGMATPVAAILRLLNAPVVALLGAGTMERVCFAAMGVYLATYLLQSYAISLGTLAGALALVALGNLAGNILGGQVADRLPARPLSFAASALATGLLALPLMLWQPGLAISVALGFAYSCANALGRPALLTALSEVSSDARGAVLGLNVTTASLGWIAATAVGGELVTRLGFGSLGVFSAAAAVTGAGLAAASWWGARRRARR